MSAAYTTLLREDEKQAAAARAMLAALKDITKIFAVSKGMQKAHSIARAAITQAEAAGIGESPGHTIATSSDLAKGDAP